MHVKALNIENIYTDRSMHASELSNCKLNVIDLNTFEMHQTSVANN